MIVKCNKWEGLQLIESQISIDSEEMIKPILISMLDEGNSDFCFEFQDKASLEIAGSEDSFLVVFFDNAEDESYSIHREATPYLKMRSFVAAGQLVEVEASACFSLGDVTEIASYFFLYGEMHPDFNWLKD